MKMNRIIKRIGLAISFTGLFCNITFAQDKPIDSGKSEATIALSYFKKADMNKTAIAIVKTKNKEGKFVPAINAKVNFYVLNDKEQQLLKSAITDNKGKAEITIQKGLPLDENLSFTIVAKIEKDKLYEDVEEQMHYKNANLTLNLNPHDTARLVTAKVTETDKDGKEIPLKGIELRFYVQRMYGNMPASEENTVSTDDKGEASFTFPKNIPGDTAGVVNITVRMEDNEQYGNVENNAGTSWGSPLAIIKDPFPRAIWAPNAPWGIVITLSTLFSGVWLTYCFILWQLRAIKKEGDELQLKN